MPRPSNTDARKAEIVEALLTVMTERGYRGASVSEIARAAGLAPGLVHYHFENKQEILLALVARLEGSLRERYRARTARARTARQRLLGWLDAHVERGPDADPRAVACWSLVGAEALTQPEVRVLYAAAIARSLDELAELVRDALREDGRDPRAARRIAAALLSAIEGAFRIASAAPDALPEGFAAPMLRRMAEGLVAAEPAGAPSAERRKGAA